MATLRIGAKKCNFMETFCYIHFLAISVDYDLYFSDETRSAASQVIPFYTGSKSSITIAMWVQFTQKDENGIFFTLYSVS